jgi:hypothetical protein
VALAKLTIDLEARLANFEQDLKKAAQASETTAKQIDRAFNVMKVSGAAIGAALASAFSGATLAAIRRVADGLDAIGDLSDATGATVENLSALEDIALRTGTSFEGMASTLVKFNAYLGDAKAGSAAADALKRLGLNAEELRRLDPAEALRQTAVALGKFADDGDKARFVQEAFGKSVREAAPFLKDLADQTELLGKRTKEEIDAAKAFKAEIDAFSKTLSDTGRDIVGVFLPAFNKMTKAWRDAKAEAAGGSLLDGLLGTNPVARLRSESEALNGDIRRAVDSIERMQEALNRKGGDDSNLAVRIEKARARLSGLQSQLIATNDKLKGLADIMDPPKEKQPEEEKKGLGSATEKKITELDKYIDKLEKAREAALGLNAEEQAYLDIYLGRLGQVTDEQEKRIIGMVRETEELKKRTDAEKRLQAIIDSTPTAKLEALRKTQIALAEAFERGKFGALDSADAVKAYSEAVAVTLPEAAKEAVKEIEKLSETNREFAENIDALLGSGLENTLSGNFESIARDWERMLSQMAIRAAQQNLSKWLLGSDYNATGYVGGALGSIIGTGGTYPVGGVYEGSYAPPMGGTQSARGGRQSVVHNHIYNVQAGVNRGEVISALRMSEQAQEARTTERLRRAGVA